MDSPATSAALSDSQQHRLLHKLDLFRLQGRDRRGRAVLRVVAKFFPARYVSVEALTKYLEERILPGLEGRKFAVVYVHTGVRRSENCPGISALRSIYEAFPVSVKRNLEAVYFVHPGLQARLFLATFGRLLFAGGLYEKIRYVNRVEFLWEEVRRKEVELPEFVYEIDDEMEHRPIMADSGSESDHLRLHHGAPFMDPAAVSSYSMRCIA
ncbi:CRAL-TRIO domain-containing protein [Psidium guajava]|nr:CRAL-TRIO domain-containing protein [Psidium guajava]